MSGLLVVPVSALEYGRTVAAARGFHRPRRELATLGAPAAPAAPAVNPFDWIPISPVDGDYQFYGYRAYAIHAYLADTLSVQWAADKLTSRGWTVGYTWQQGQRSRGAYPIDDSLVGLGPAPSGWIRVYGEADAPKAGTNATAPLGDEAPVSLSILLLGNYYAINQAWELEPATTTNPTAPVVTSCPAPPAASNTGTLLGAAAGLVVGGTVGYFARGWL